MKEDDPRECVGDWASQELWKRDAEIAIDRMKAEIDRLNAENDNLIEQFKALREICYQRDLLISELADALEIYGSMYPGTPLKGLIQRARKATR